MVLGGIMSKVGGGKFADGAASAGLTQLVMNELKNIKDPAVLQWATAIVGAAAAKVVGGNAQTGAGVAVSEVRNNWLSHWQKEERQKAIDEEDWEKVAYWDRIDEAQDQIFNSMGINPNLIDWTDPINSKLLESISNQAQELEASSNFQNSFLENLPTVDYSTIVATGAISVVVGGAVLYKYNGSWVKAGSSIAATGSVWDKITPTAANISGTAIPATFQIQNGQRILWVNSNATEHMGEYITRFGNQSWSTGIRSQAMLSSFNASVEEAMVQLASSPVGRYFISVGNWE